MKKSASSGLTSLPLLGEWGGMGQTQSHLLEQRYSELPSLHLDPLEGFLNGDCWILILRVREFAFLVCSPVDTALGPHLENRCSRVLLKISDKWAQARRRGKYRSLEEVGSPAAALSFGLKSQPSPPPPHFCVVSLDLDGTLAIWLKRRGQKEDPLCLLAARSRG